MASVSPVLAATRQLPSIDPPASRSRGALAGALIALAGVAAAYVVASRNTNSAGATARDTMTVGESAADNAAPADDSPTSLPIADSQRATGKMERTAVVDNAKPAAAAAEPGGSRGSAPVDRAPAHLVAASPIARAAPQAPVTQVAQVAQVAQAPAAPAVPPPPAKAAEPEPTGLAGAIKRAAGPSGAPQAAAVPTAAPPPAIRGDVPEVPAQGALQSALGSQRSEARACIAGQDTPSRANVVFASTGKVQTVSVSGPAAGTAAETCIRNAFSKANVGPFRRPTFSLSTTITP